MLVSRMNDILLRRCDTGQYHVLHIATKVSKQYVAKACYQGMFSLVITVQFNLTVDQIWA